MMKIQREHLMFSMSKVLNLRECRIWEIDESHIDTVPIPVFFDISQFPPCFVKHTVVCKEKNLR